MDTHEFAFFWSDLSERFAHYNIGGLIVITDKDLVHRITKIIRLQPDEQFILFDRTLHVQCTLHDIPDKKTIHCRLEKKEAHRVIKPEIKILLPLLKREALHEALYSAVELGATEVCFVLTDKVHRKWGGDHEFERLHNVMIAAAEQSKNFTLPTLGVPIILSDILKSLQSKDASRIFFDPEGQRSLEVIQQLSNPNNSIVLLLGPEGDLTTDEKKMVKQSGFLSVALTPTILRAQQALVVGLGLFRSLIR
jgi:16S rRNA (uracil1498-N3)-methyltransferase